MATVSIDSISVVDGVATVGVLVSGATVGHLLRLFVSDGGNSQLARTAQVTLAGTSGLVTLTDSEAPQGPVEYAAAITTPTGTVVALSPSEAVGGILDLGYDRLASVVDPSLTADVILGGTALTRRRTIARQAVEVVGRSAPVVITTPRREWTSDLTFFTITDEQRADVEALLATGDAVSLRPRWPRGHSLLPVEYLWLGAVSAERVSSLGYQPERLWTAAATRVQPEPAYPEVTPASDIYLDTFTASYV
jgi:hypothetical protein